MRPVVKNGIGVFYPQGFLDADSAQAMLTLDDVNATENLNVNMLLVSLKKVIFFNKNGLEAFMKVLKKVQKLKKIIIGFCDYDLNKYHSITKIFSNDLDFSLFKSYEIASLFADGFKNQNNNVLLYVEDKSQKAAMAIKLHNNGHNPVVCQTQEEFDEKRLNNTAFDTIIEHSYVSQPDNSISSRISGNSIIYTLNNFLDSETANNFNIEYHNNSLQVGFRLFIFEANQVKSMNVHALNFFSKLATSGAEYNATICFAGMGDAAIPDKFKETLEDCGIMLFDTIDDILNDKELVAELGGSKAAMVKNKRALNKAIVAELPTFIDATVSTINMMTNAEAKKESAQVQKLSIEDKKDRLASSIGFYGEIDGMLILTFPKKIAQKACGLLIGEDTDDIELILDSLSEFVNIIGGKVKTSLVNDNKNVMMTLPRTYQSIDELLEITGDKKGVQVDLAFDNDKFSFFLTR